MLQATLIFASLIARPLGFTNALLLSDMSTPSFVIDMRSLRKRYSAVDKDTIPSLHLPRHGISLYPSSNKEEATKLLDLGDATAISIDLQDRIDEAAIGYLHTCVVKSREDAGSGNNSSEDDNTFLAELDLPPSLCGSDGARLVLGLNNHHVGSYYWARSAGAGSSVSICNGTFHQFAYIIRSNV